ncbi:DUF4911 domain-containing protein [Desulfosediminicola flagellatus]|uniref:DUF4911 domain-containing protein n=1 Tax=Desulfosediminicola flagellatus TaxID=2569541 RepID=UPI0010AB9CD6
MTTCSQELYLRIAPDRFHYLKFILEGYDNMAILSSYDMKKGLVLVRYIADSRKDLFGLLSSIAPKLV